MLDPARVEENSTISQAAGLIKRIMNSIRNTFKYEKLDEGAEACPIRLIELLPARDLSDSVRCHIYHASLADGAAYEALSYTWGEPTATMPIHLEDELHHITINLECALRYLRHEDRPRIVWIDALCINQQDTLERNQQVTHMREIYEGAKQVLVWLGEGDAKAAFDWMSGKVAALADPLREIECLRTLRESMNVPTAGYRSMWSYINEVILERQWWSRAWIVQEVTCGNSILVHVGGDNIEFSDILVIALTCKSCSQEDNLFEAHMGFQQPTNSTSQNTRGTEAPEMVSTDTEDTLRKYEQYITLYQAYVGQSRLTTALFRVEAEQKRRRQDQDGMNMYYLLNTFRGQEATDPKDKVFSMLGLMRPDQRIKVDYSVEKYEVYKAAAHTMFAHSSLRFLLLVEPQYNELSSSTKLPSWVPDWKKKQGLICSIMEAKRTSFDAGRGASSVHRRLSHISGDTLYLYGRYVAIVTHTRSSSVIRNLPTEEQIALLKHDRITLLKYDRTPTKPSLSSTEYSLSSQDTPLANTTIISASWGPQQTKVGDIIIVVADLELPLVLRPLGDKYLFMGCCWLIDSELKMFRLVGTGADECGVAENDPGFSRIMFGAAWEGIMADDKLEEYRVC